MINGPLTGLSIGVTADRRADEQIELLQRRGAAVVHGRTIRTLPVDADQALRGVTQRLLDQPPQFLIANTGIGVRSWFVAAESWGIGDALIDALSDTQVFARGPKAAAATHAVGLQVTCRAASERLDEVVELLLAESISGATIAYQEHGDEAPGLVARLEAAGAQVVRVPIYRWIVPADTGPAVRLIEAVLERRLQAVTFTCAPAIRNMFAIAAAEGLADALQRALADDIVVACVGPVCAGEAVAQGIASPVVPVRSRLGLMVRSLGDHLSSRAEIVDIAGHRVRLQGVALVIDDEVVTLPDREAAMLAALLRRRNAVISKEALLRDVWGAASTDVHVVEVTLSRLRTRLGALGNAIRTVPRRGYVIEAELVD